MGRGVKRSGTRWEREAVRTLNMCESATFRRIPGSGSMAYHTGMSSLSGDIEGKYPWWARPFRIEAKYGYGTAKSMSFKREWMEKIIEEAGHRRDHPAMVIKFRDVHSGDQSAKLIVFTMETWNKLMAELESLWNHVDELERKLDDANDS